MKPTDIEIIDKSYELTSVVDLFKYAYNLAIEKAAESAELDLIRNYTACEISKESILKLKY